MKAKNPKIKVARCTMTIRMFGKTWGCGGIASDTNRLYCAACLASLEATHD
jgi:peroxiredoxin family protein